MPPQKRSSSPATGDDSPGTDRPTTGKGRPTPKRKEVEAARRRPLGSTDRKAAAKKQRAAARTAREREYQALQTGDERYLPARDKGPVKRWVRDYVDARRSLGEFFLPLSIGMLLATFLTANSVVAGLVTIVVLYLIVAATIIDAFVLSRILKKRLARRFGEQNVPRGSLMYGVLRAFQIRRTRLPKPQVKRGEYPSSERRS